MIVGLYEPGCSFLHRQRPGLKLLVLFALGVGLVLVHSLPALLFICIFIAVTYVCVAGLSRLWQATRPFLIWLVLIGVAQAFVSDMDSALRVLLRLVTLVWAAFLITQTTRLSDMTESLVSLCRVLHPLGVSPNRVAFMIALTVRLIPALSELVREVRDSQRARGLERSVFATVVPVLTRILQQTDVMSDALTARGYDRWDETV